MGKWLSIERYRGAMVGLAVGDALGAHVEGWPRGTFEPVTDMAGGGVHDLAPGQWTDDTAMALCLAESLIECAGFDPIDQLQRYVRWYREGYRSSTGESFGIGDSTRAALTRFEQIGDPFPGDAEPTAATNGCLMKLAPVPLAFASDPDLAVERAADCARTTHGAPEAIDAARLLARLIVAALHEAPKSELVAIDSSFRLREPEGSRDAARALEAALWAFDATDSYAEGVLKVVNLGDDADTTAAIYGQLAGAYYGIDAIQPRWRSELAQIDWILTLADALHGLATQRPVSLSF